MKSKYMVLCVYKISGGILVAMLCTILFSACSTKEEYTQIDLIKTPLFDKRYNYILVKDSYVRAFLEKDSTQNVEKVFRKGSILPLVVSDTQEQKDKRETSIWYQIQYTDKLYWIYAQDVVLCTFLSQALLFKKRLYY